MKKTLHRQEIAFLSERDGNLRPEETNIEEILAAVNRGLKGDWGNIPDVEVTLRMLHGWICRYIEEGATEEFLNELNADLHQIQYYNYVVPADFYSTDGEEPQSVYVTNLNFNYSHEAVAAKEFSRMVSYGMLNRLKLCQMSDCENIFLGPPQAKWCSTTCGSKFRVRKKRKRDL